MASIEYKVIDGCIGCGLCENTCPAVFRLTDEGVAEAFANPTTNDEEHSADEAMANCPVSVITKN